MPGFLLLDKAGRLSPGHAPQDGRCWPEYICVLKLQRAARAFLLRLVAENGVEEAAAILRELADEIEGLPELDDGEGNLPDQAAH